MLTHPSRTDRPAQLTWHWLSYGWGPVTSPLSFPLVPAGRRGPHSPAGLLGRGMGAPLLLGPAEVTEAAAGALGAAWEPLELGLEARAEAGLDGTAFFSGTFASATG